MTQQRFLLIIALLAAQFRHPMMGVNAQFDGGTCNRTLGPVKATVAGDKCDCPVEPKCSACNLTSNTVGSRGVVVCNSACEFCDPAQSFCGTFGYRYSRWETIDFAGPIVVPSYSMTWTYTKGRTGTVIYSLSRTLPNVDATCSVLVNGQFCKSCQIRRCRADDSLEPRIDCTNLEPGATAGSEQFICKNRTSSGSVSLDDSARSGVLAPLAFPFYLCQLGDIVFRNDAVVPPPVSTPINTPKSPVVSAPIAGPMTPASIQAPMDTPKLSPVGSTPVAGPVTPPVAGDSPSSPSVTNGPPTVLPNADKKCGLLNLGIICLRGCGWFRRTLGLCKSDLFAERDVESCIFDCGDRNKKRRVR